MTPTLDLNRPAVAAVGDVETAKHLARQLGRQTLVSRIAPLPAIPDPLAFLHAASHALGHGVLWDQSAAGIAFAGAGIAHTIAANGSSRFGSVTSAIDNLAPLIVRDDDEIFPLIGGFAFTPNAERQSRVIPSEARNLGAPHNGHPRSHHPFPLRIDSRSERRRLGGESPLWREFPDALLVIPGVLLQVASDAAFVRVTAPVDPAASPTDIDATLRSALEQARRWAEAPLPAHPQPSLLDRYPVPERPIWESSVAAAVSLIHQNHLDKVVLAREERLLFDHAPSPTTTLARLRSVGPAATRFALQSGGSWFIGSTPERLARLHHGRVDVACLAGSIAIGRDDDETRTLAARLLASAKDREEHDIVVRSTIQALQEVCEHVASAPGAPHVVQARSVQHLQTPLTACMPHAGRVLDLVERLHPTPAVGGYPRERALAAIRELETFDRGWYAAPFGWTDLNGDGEFAVAIRSGLLTGRAASLFAGGGIVADSVPAAEWDETCLKLRPMLNALGAS